jgi:hypothetical protein
LAESIDEGTISSAAEGPKSVEADGVKVEAHPLPDQIAADKYLAQKAAADQKHGGIRITLLNPGGATRCP